MSPAETESGSATIAPAAQHGSQLLPIGFLGAYTTLSTMAMDGVRLLDQGRPGLALATGWRRYWWGRWPRCGEDR
jgi:fluoride ion exporter CrcB/FEX